MQKLTENLSSYSIKRILGIASLVSLVLVVLYLSLLRIAINEVGILVNQTNSGGTLIK